MIDVIRTHLGRGDVKNALRVLNQVEDRLEFLEAFTESTIGIIDAIGKNDAAYSFLQARKLEWEESKYQG